MTEESSPNIISRRQFLIGLGALGVVTAVGSKINGRQENSIEDGFGQQISIPKEYRPYIENIDKSTVFLHAFYPNGINSEDSTGVVVEKNEAYIIIATAKHNLNELQDGTQVSARKIRMSAGPSDVIPNFLDKEKYVVVESPHKDLALIGVPREHINEPELFVPVPVDIGSLDKGDSGLTFGFGNEFLKNGFPDGHFELAEITKVDNNIDPTYRAQGAVIVKGDSGSGFFTISEGRLHVSAIVTHTRKNGDSTLVSLADYELLKQKLLNDLESH